MTDEQFEQQAAQQKTFDPHCLFRSMPMKKPEGFGTNADGSKNSEYCCRCLVNGERK